MGFLPVICLCILILKLDQSSAQGALGAEQNVEGLISPRSNVVMQSVVLGRRRPQIFDSRDLDDEIGDCPHHRKGIRHFFRRFLGSAYPLPYKQGEPELNEETDSETIDSEMLERLTKESNKFNHNGNSAEGANDIVEQEHLDDLDRNKGRPRKFMRSRDGRRIHHGAHSRIKHEDYDNGSIWKKNHEEDGEVGKRLRSRRAHRRREVDRYEPESEGVKKSEEEKHKNGFEEDWGDSSHKSESWQRKSRGPRETLFLPPQYPQGSQLLGSSSSDEYIK